MADPPILLLGTFNRKKGEELVHLLTLPWLGVRTLAEMPPVEEVVETGETFAANAALKAAGYAGKFGLWTLGEDSGLEVEALDGEPGVFSARFSGPEATDETNNRLLLERLASAAEARRAARYVCHMVLADPSGVIRAESEGVCRGRIIDRPRGTHGFGYDPLFEVPEYHRTFGQLGPAAKAALSHRARAARQLRPALERLLGAGLSR